MTDTPIELTSVAMQDVLQRLERAEAQNQRLRELLKFASVFVDHHKERSTWFSECTNDCQRCRIEKELQQ